jgi:type I restriction-modification system DNA methylase subunit
MSRKLVTNSGNDIFYTPSNLACSIVGYLNPTESYLEPCLGSGSFFNSVNISKDYCEIEKGIDFLTYEKKVNWIITNPPFSKFKDFLKKSLEIANHVAFLCPINHFTTKARVNLIFNAGFSIKEILLLKETPKEFPQSGFQWGVVYLSKGSYNTKITYLS